MPKMSFVVPVYNKSDEILSKCIKSLLNQALKEIEVICVLDGPQEGSRTLLERLLDIGGDNAHKVIETAHGGACAARNEGFKHARAPYVCFFDADCIIEPDWAWRCVNIFEKEPDASFIYSGYTFLGENAGAIPSEPFDPWTLRVRNYISTCFPMRREVFPGFDEGLKSLQDWDLWLTIVARGGKGRYVPGYAFATELPAKDSISGQGCTDEMWIERLDAVKKKHELPERDMVICAPRFRQDGIHLAKLIDADYQDFPEYKPHRYKRLIKVGFNFMHSQMECAQVGNPKVERFLFWNNETIETYWMRLSRKASDDYAILFNANFKRQFVEDKAAYEMMKRAGLNVEIMPMPMKAEGMSPMPDKPCFLIDCSAHYGELFNAIDAVMPDIKIARFDQDSKIDEYTGLLHFYTDRTLSSNMKRMLLKGRHVISNVQSEFCGFIEDRNTSNEDLIVAVVAAIRDVAYKPLQEDAAQYWAEKLSMKNFLEELKNGRTGQLCNPVA